MVIEAKDLSKGHGDRLLFDDLSFSIPPGAIVGIIGGNGVGKTTLFELITGNQETDAGTLRLGETVKLGYVDQSRSTLDPEKTVWEVISDGSESVWLGRVEVNSRAYAARFGFTGSDQQTLVKNLSGGERNRLLLAQLFTKPANLLVLDEPVSDLDPIVRAELLQFLLEVLREDYVRTARAKGLKERTVVYGHALKNALIPVLTIFGLQMGQLLAGALASLAQASRRSGNGHITLSIPISRTPRSRSPSSASNGSSRPGSSDRSRHSAR